MERNVIFTGIQMKVLITGAAGFIGYHTSLKFKELGHSVVGFDNFNDYYDPWLKRLREKNLNEKGVSVINGDLTLKGEIDSAIQNENPDFVIHLGAMAGVRYSTDHPEEYIENNMMGTNNLIKAMERAGTKNVIFASTSCVMHGHELPWKEEAMLHPQINAYGYSKMVNESQFNISKIPNAVGMRFFTVYGPYGRPDMALFNFTKDILANKPVTLYNYGKMKRDFTYIDDIVQGIECVFNNMTPRDMYNIGRGEQVDLMRFVTAIEDALDRKAIIKYGPKHPADAVETWSDTTKLKAIGYNPKTSIEEGVQNFVKWYRETYN